MSIKRMAKKSVSFQYQQVNKKRNVINSTLDCYLSVNGRLATVEIEEIARTFPTFRSEWKKTSTPRGSLQFQKGFYEKYSSIWLMTYKFLHAIFTFLSLHNLVSLRESQSNY